MTDTSKIAGVFAILQSVPIRGQNAKTVNRSALSLILLAASPVIYAADFTADMQAKLERLLRFPYVHGRSPVGSALSPDGKYIIYGANPKGERRLDAYVLTLGQDKPKLVVEASKIDRLPDQDRKPTEKELKERDDYDGGISGFTWAPDSKEVLFAYRGRTFRMNPDGSDLRPVVDGNQVLGSPSYSPDGKYLAFMEGSNLWRMDRATGGLKQLTFLSRPQTSIYGYDWSPDGKRLVVFWWDDSKTGQVSMMDYTKDRPQPVTVGRDWNGTEPYAAKIGIVEATGGLVKFVEKLPDYMWLTGGAWSPDSKKYVFGWKDKTSQSFTLSRLDAASAKKLDIYTEKAPSNYITAFRPVLWDRAGRVIFGTDIIDGKWTNRAILSMDEFGRDVKNVYRKDHDVSAVVRPKNSDRLLLVTQRESGLRSELQVVEPDGTIREHTPVKGWVTPQEFDDAGNPMASDDGKVIVTLSNTYRLNPELYQIEPTAKRLTFSQTPDFDKVEWADRQDVFFKSADGATIHGQLLVPKGLKPGEKVPAVIHSIYANSGKASWGGYVADFMATECKMAVLLVDFRASYGYGGEFNSGYYQRMGLVDADESVAAKNFLASLPYVRGDRVGIWGWSYGGFLTSMVMFTKPGVFDTGVAVASVTDWKNYNEGYTRTRLGEVSKNEEVYKKTSPIHHVAGLQGNLLLVHGILDDNVLAHDTVRMMQRLIEANRHFDVALYPRDDHSIGRIESRPHVFVTIVRYLYEKLTR